MIFEVFFSAKRAAARQTEVILSALMNLCHVLVPVHLLGESFPTGRTRELFQSLVDLRDVAGKVALSPETFATPVALERSQLERKTNCSTRTLKS